MQVFRSAAARLKRHEWRAYRPVAAGEATRAFFTASNSKILADILGSVGFSRFCTNEEGIKASPVRAVPKGCLMYFGGMCQLPNHLLEGSDSFLQTNPILLKVSQRMLITPRQGKDYMAAEGGKSFISNALLLPYILHSHGISSKGLFDEDNVVVLKQLGTLAFREIGGVAKDEITQDEKGENIQEALSWIKKKTLESLGIEIKDLPKEMQKLFGYLTETPVDIDKIVTDVSLLPRESRALLIMRMYGLVKMLLSRAIVNSKILFKQNDSFDNKVTAALNLLPLTDPDSVNILRVQKFYDQLPYTKKCPSYGPEWTTNVQMPNSFLKPFVGKMGGKKLVQQGPPPNGKGLLHLHRNGVVHWMDEDIIRLIQQVAAAQRISIPDHSLGDVLDLIQYEFPEFLQVVVALFKAEGWLPALDLWSLLTGPKCLLN